METYNFNAENFLEPTQKYINEWYNKSHIKEMYNADLIFFVRQYNGALEDGEINVINFMTSYAMYVSLYDLPDLKTIVELFRDYSEDDFSELSKFCYQQIK